MMCKAKAWVLALTAGLLLLLIPAQARADVTRLLILNDEQTSETSAAATDVLRRFALYSSWTCTFVSSEDVPDTDGYTAVIICTDPNRALNASVALAIQESKLPVFVIGAGGLAELTKTQVYEGSLTLRLQTQANAAERYAAFRQFASVDEEKRRIARRTIFVGAQAFPLCQTAGKHTHLACILTRRRKRSARSSQRCCKRGCGPTRILRPHTGSISCLTAFIRLLTRSGCCRWWRCLRRKMCRTSCVSCRFTPTPIIRR